MTPAERLPERPAERPAEGLVERPAEGLVERVTCDTSVLVPGLLAWHPAHEAVRSELAAVDGLPAHVLLEAYSVLTRLPAPHRIRPADAAAVLAALTWPIYTLTGPRLAHLVAQLAEDDIRGGAAYDALVGATARQHDALLLTRDRRARVSYDALGVRYRLL